MKAVDKSDLSQGAETSGVPIRLCIGCRRHGLRSDLVRFVASAHPSSSNMPVTGRLLADKRKNFPGRGAWLHPTSDCARLALRRRAFSKALRMPIDDVTELNINIINGSG